MSWSDRKVLAKPVLSGGNRKWFIDRLKVESQTQTNAFINGIKVLQEDCFMNCQLKLTFSPEKLFSSCIDFASLADNDAKRVRFRKIVYHRGKM